MHRKLVLLAGQLEGYLRHFPNCHKYTLTLQIRQAYLDVYNLTTEAQKRYHKKTTLTQLDIRHEQLRMLVLLAHEMGLFDFSGGKRDAQTPGEHRYLVLSKMIDELGRMIGGWVRTELRGPDAAPHGTDAVRNESDGRLSPAGAVVA